LAWAVIFLLAIDPGLATDFGFSLSALATVGLLTMALPIYNWLSRYMPRLIAIGIAASFSAQLATTPVLLMLQPSIPIYSVLANLIVEPVVAPVTVLGILALILAYPLPVLSSALSYVASLGTWWITLVATEVSGWPAARVHFVAGPVGVALASLIVLFEPGALSEKTFEISNRDCGFSCRDNAVFGLLVIGRSDPISGF